MKRCIHHDDAPIISVVKPATNGLAKGRKEAPKRLTWLATVPPTAGIVGKLFGTRYLGTLFGLTLLSHQIGGFFGAWLGGLAMDANGNYQWMWYADIALALLAALSNLPIKEAKVIRTPVDLKPAT